jgi:ABC-2 type transport system permease protein
LIEADVIYVVVAREFKKFTRERTKLVSSVARPVIWLFLMGVGMGRMIPAKGGIDYMHFMFPGIIGMTILFSAFFSAISIIWDKEFGYMKEMLAAPISRTSIVAGKAISGSMVSTLQAVIILALFPVLGLSLGAVQIIEVILISILLSFMLSSIGILVAAFYESFDSFSVIMNFIVMPMFFLSGAMYPLRTLPSALKFISRINPLTYGVDALKNVIFQAASGEMAPDFPLSVDLAVMAFVSVVFLYAGTRVFSRRA